MYNTTQQRVCFMCIIHVIILQTTYQTNGHALQRTFKSCEEAREKGYSVYKQNVHTQLEHIYIHVIYVYVVLYIYCSYLYILIYIYTIHATQVFEYAHAQLLASMHASYGNPTGKPHDSIYGAQTIRFIFCFQSEKYITQIHFTNDGFYIKAI